MLLFDPVAHIIFVCIRGIYVADMYLIYFYLFTLNHFETLDHNTRVRNFRKMIQTNFHLGLQIRLKIYIYYILL